MQKPDTNQAEGRQSSPQETKKAAKLSNEASPKMSDSRAPKQNEARSKFSGFWNKFFWLLIVILLAYNIKLYLDKQVPIHFEVTHEGVIMENHAGYISDSGLQELVTKLAAQQKVRRLKASLGLNLISDVSPLLKQIEVNKQLTHLTLSIGSNPISNSTAANLAATLRQLTNLEDLTLGLDGIFDFEGRKAISEAVATLPKLHSLKLSFINVDFSGLGLTALFPIAKQRQLKSLELLLVGCKIQEEEAKHLQTLLAQLPKLDKLDLNLYANKLKIDGAVHLSGGLFQQRQAQQLGVDLYFSNITANGTEALMGAIGSMTNLTRLQLGLEFNYIGDDGGVHVAKGIEKLAQLKHLALNAATKNFGWVGYSSILTAIEKLQPLESLEIIIGVNKCGPKGAELLKSLLFRHDKLKKLKINYLENYVTDAGATFIAEGIKSQKQLEEVHVNINFNTLSDRGAIEIAKALEQAKSPKKIELRLSQNQISDKGAKEIFGIVNSTLQRVDKYDLEFMNTALTNATRDELLVKYPPHQKFELRINTIPPSNWD